MQDQRYKKEGEEALAQLVEFTGSNDGWKHEKTTSVWQHHVWQYVCACISICVPVCPSFPPCLPPSPRVV